MGYLLCVQGDVAALAGHPSRWGPALAGQARRPGHAAGRRRCRVFIGIREPTDPLVCHAPPATPPGSRPTLRAASAACTQANEPTGSRSRALAGPAANPAGRRGREKLALPRLRRRPAHVSGAHTSGRLAGTAVAKAIVESSTSQVCAATSGPAVTIPAARPARRARDGCGSSVPSRKLCRKRWVWSPP